MAKQDKWIAIHKDDQYMCEYGNGTEPDFTCNTCQQSSEPSAYSGKVPRMNRAHWRREVAVTENRPDYLCDFHYERLTIGPVVVVEWLSADEFASHFDTK